MKTLKEVIGIERLHALPLKLDNQHHNYDVDTDYLDHNNLAQHYNKSQYSFDQQASVKTYTGNGYRSINGMLWDKHNDIRDSRHSNEENKDHVRHIDSAMHKVLTPKSMHVWSGLQDDPRQHMDEKNIVHHPGFLSTSTRSGTAFDFATGKGSIPSEKHLMKIHVPKDHPGIYVGGNGGAITEREFILPRGTNLKLKHTKTVDVDTSNGVSWQMPPKHEKGKSVRYHIHHMEIVP